MWWRRCSLYEHSLVRPGDLRRLDTAFFTVNGVISVAFFAVRARGLPVIRRARALHAASARSASWRSSTSTSRTAASSSSRARTAPGRRRCSGCAPVFWRRPRASSGGGRPRAASVSSAHEPLVYRELTALENLDLYGRLYRVPERRERIGMLLERFGLWSARNERAGVVLARDAAAAGALPRAPARARAAHPRRAVQRPRRRGRRAARPASWRSCAADAPSSSRPTTRLGSRRSRPRRLALA